MRRLPAFLVTVTAAAGLLATAPAASALEPTEIEWTYRSYRVVYGSTAILEGKVQAPDHALKAVRVRLYVRRSTSDPWTYLTYDTTSSADGRFRFERRPPQNYYYQVRYAGSSIYEPSEADARVEVRRKLTPNSFAGVPGGKFRFTGPAKPTEKSKYKTIKMWKKNCKSCTWQTIGETATNGDAQWSFTITGPTQSGRTYYYQAYSVATSDFAVGYSTTLQISAQ